MAKKNLLAKLSDVGTKNFIEKVKEQYVEKYAQDVVKILEDQRKLAKALEFVSKYVAKIEKGEYEAIEEYKRKRQKLEITEDAIFEDD